MRNCTKHPDSYHRCKYNGGNLFYICDECGQGLYYQREITFTGGRHLLAHLKMARTRILKSYEFEVHWSYEDEAWIGTEGSHFPSLSYIADTYQEAHDGIVSLVHEEDYWMRKSFQGH